MRGFTSAATVFGMEVRELMHAKYPQHFGRSEEIAEAAVIRAARP